MDPITLIAGGGLIIWLISRNKSRKKGPPKIVWDGDAWAAPTDRWWGGAEVNLAALLISDPTIVDPRVLSWGILQDQVPASIGGLPPTPYAPDGTPWQVDVPGVENYWDGAPTVIYLMDHVAEAITAALPHWQATGEVVLVQGG